MGEEEERYAIVEDAHPLIYVRVVGPLTERSFLRYQDELLATMRQQPGPFAVILDPGSLQFVPHRVIALAVQWIKSTKQEFGDRWVSAAFVLENALLRRLTSAMFWASGHVVEMSVLGTHAEARAWSRERLAAAGSPAGVERTR